MGTALVSAAELSQSVEWLNLVHYKPQIFGGYKSQVDGTEFFLAPEGTTNPEAELTATVAAANGPREVSSNLACRFPARVLFLKKHDLLKGAPAKCEKYDAWKNRISIQSASLVFSSYYLNNPSSAFGHTFLRLHNSKAVSSSGEHFELLDNGVNFSANPWTQNPFLYALMGLVGGFKGTFTAVPYYYKVREYNDFEARDLWSYDLNLSADELEMLVAHLWELGQTHYDYFYFDENCSYHMLTTLEAAAPRLRLTEHLPFYVIPSETIRVVGETPGLVSKISFRPSIRAVFRERLSRLDREERQWLKATVADFDLNALPASASPASKARVLDGALDFLEFKYPGDILSRDTPSAKWKKQVLLARARVDVQSDEVVVALPQDERPDGGHRAGRWTLAGGVESTGGSGNFNFWQLEYRFALHDLLDQGAGYPKNAEIQFGNLGARYTAAGNFEVDNLRLFKVVSLNPWSEFSKGLSFNSSIGLEKLWDRNCNRCLAGVFEGGPGLAFELGMPQILLFGFLNAQVATSNQLPPSGWRLGVGPTTGLLLEPLRGLRVLAQGAYRYFWLTTFTDHYEFKLETRWTLSNTLALNLVAVSAPSAANQGQWQMGMNWYL